MKKIICHCATLFAALTTFAQTNPPALQSITIADLKKDIYDLADGHFKGRSAGTIDELKASEWLADKFRQIGLQPAGDDGTYLQFFNMWRNRVAATTEISINGKPLRLRQVLTRMFHYPPGVTAEV